MTFQDFLNEIQKCIDNKCYIASLTMALMIPDICGKALFPKDETGKRYKKWYTQYIGDYYYNNFNNNSDIDKASWMNEDLIYSLRCCMLHEALPTIKKKDIIVKENKIDVFEIQFTDSAIFFCSDISTKGNGIKERKMSINAKTLSEQLLGCGTDFYNDHKKEIDNEYSTIVRKN